MINLQEAGVGGMILKAFQKILSIHTQRVKIVGVCSLSIDVVSGVPQGSILGPLLFLLYIADLSGLLQNVLVGYAAYADDSTLLCRIPHPCDRASVVASLNDDLAVISDWCSMWGILVNPKRRGGMLISCSRAVEHLVIDGSIVEKIFGAILDSKLASESKSEQFFCLKEGRYFEKTMSVFQDVAVVAKCFWAFILPVLEYCSPVWMSAATSHLLLLVHVVGRVRQLSVGSVS